MIRPQIWNDAVNNYWRQRSLTDDEFYFGLGDRIKERQESKVPVAGAGTVEFLALTGAVTSGVAVFVPVLRPLARLYNRAIESLQDSITE